MAIRQSHLPFYREILAIPGILSDPVLVFGFQEIFIKRVDVTPSAQLTWRERLKKLRRSLRLRWQVMRGQRHRDTAVPEEYTAAPDLASVIRQRGIENVHVLDFFDDRADLRYDMNDPVPKEQHERYGSLLDIGCLEHVFDTRQCMENCLAMVRTDGFYVLHTPVNGYLRHGLHVFNPEGLIEAIRLNGFDIVYCKFSSSKGAPVDDPAQSPNAIMWLVAKKRRKLDGFKAPQQGLWKDRYES